MTAFGEIPQLREEMAHRLYDLAMIHTMLLGWASLAIIGGIYYFVPKAAEKNLYSERLGRIHFWLTNITLPIGVLLFVYGSFLVESLIESGVSGEVAFSQPSTLPLFIGFFGAFIVGIIAQFLFVYNIYRTMRQ